MAIYDSRGRRFNNDKNLKLGSPVTQDQLLNVMALDDSVITREASSRSVSTTRKRPESISVKGKNLEEIANLQNNSSYRMSTLTCDLYDPLGEKSASYYVGVDSGRISDKKDNHFTLDELNSWLLNIEETLSSNSSVQSNLVHSFAKPILIDTNLQIESVIFDLSELEYPLNVSSAGHDFILDNNFIFFEYNSGFLIDKTNPAIVISIELKEEIPYLQLSSESHFLYSMHPGGRYKDDFLDFLTVNLHKALLEKGISYSQNMFFELKLPIEGDYKIVTSSLANVVIGMDNLINTDLDEKGYVDREIQVETDSFSTNSVFHLLDQLKSNASTNPTLTELGPFNQYIPAADLVLCADMGTEPADFILSSPNKLVYVHVKCGSSSNSPQSSAGAIFEVGSQAIKNIDMLISADRDLRPVNWTALLSKWPSASAPQVLQERIRMFKGERFANSIDDANLREEKLIELWDVVAERRRNSNVEKEIWIVAANSFSASHFELQLNTGNRGRGESLQAYQLIQGWVATAHINDVNLKIFVSP